jgi:hypothetical protein
MDWVFDNLQFLLIAAGTIAYWLNQRREARQREQTPAGLPPPTLHELPPGRELEERPVLLPDELRRRILEQLGIPQPAVEPVAIPIPPPLPAPMAPPPLPEPLVVAAPVKFSKPELGVRTGASIRRAGLKAALHSRGKVREAFLLREILGSPVGLGSGGHLPH